MVPTVPETRDTQKNKAKDLCLQSIFLFSSVSRRSPWSNSLLHILCHDMVPPQISMLLLLPLLAIPILFHCSGVLKNVLSYGPLFYALLPDLERHKKKV